MQWNVQVRPKTFKNVYKHSKKEDVRERYSINKNSKKRIFQIFIFICQKLLIILNFEQFKFILFNIKAQTDRQVCKLHISRHYNM